MDNIWHHEVIGPVSTNCYVFGTADEAILLDPGGPEAKLIVNKLNEEGINIKHVLVTHGHFDHLSWATEVKDATEGARVYLHIDEKAVYEEYHDAMKRYGIPQPDLREPDVWVQSDELLKLANFDIKVLHTPGHSPGSATFLIDKFRKNKDFNPAAFVGDCLFQGSIGRTDLAYGDSSEMQKSLNYLMNALDAGTALYPGHGGFTSMVKEMKNNPFLLALQRGVDIF